MKPILVYGKETVIFSEVTSNLLSEERRLNGGGGNILSKGSALTVENVKKKNSNKKNIVCWTSFWSVKPSKFRAEIKSTYHLSWGS